MIRPGWFMLLAIGCLGASPGPAPVTPTELRTAGLHAQSRWLPYRKWEGEYRHYFERHVHDGALSLSPTAIVMHYTVTPTMAGTWGQFARGGWYDDGDAGRVFGHLSSHFIVDRDGTVYCCLPTDRRCRGAYGVNQVALSIEMVGRDEASILQDRALVAASIRLVEVLCRRYRIPSSRVWGHYQVAAGRSEVPDYEDFGDRRFPDRYPPSDRRTDPGKRYMQKLWGQLQAMHL